MPPVSLAALIDRRRNLNENGKGSATGALGRHRSANRYSAIRMVRPSGVEPPLLSEHGPEPCASANSATGARRFGAPEISLNSCRVNPPGRPLNRWLDGHLNRAFDNPRALSQRGRRIDRGRSPNAATLHSKTATDALGPVYNSCIAQASAASSNMKRVTTSPRPRMIAGCVSFNNVVATLLLRSHEAGPEFEA